MFGALHDRPLPWGIFLAAVGVGACTFGLDRRDRPCERDEQCPAGQTCLVGEGRCVARDAGRVDGRVIADGRSPDLTPDLAVDHGVLPDVVLFPDLGADACQPVLCGVCGEGGTLEMPADDPACGTIDCDEKDQIFIDGTASATGTNYRKRRDYQDLEADRCQAIGACKAPNGAGCTESTVVTLNTCGTCKRATLSGCQNYGDYTSCGGDDRCYGGICAWPCDTHNNGTETCTTLCSWCTNGTGACRGARTDDGANVPCSHKDEPMTCYCTD